MEPMGAAASVIAVIQISKQVFDLCQTYFSEVKNARDDIRRLRDEVTSLQDVLTNVTDLADAPGSAKLSVLDLLNQPDGLIQQCRTELKGLATKLDTEQGKDHMRKFGLRALKWPFGRKDVDKTISVIRRQKEVFNLALTADTTALTVAIDQGMTQLRQDFATARIDEHSDKIIRWLSYTDPSSNHLTACKKHQPATGEWLIKGANMEVWKGTRNSLLWLYGIRPSPLFARRNICLLILPDWSATDAISSTIIEHMKGHCDKPGFALAYFYFDFSDNEKQRVSNLLSSLIAQLCNKVIDLPDHLKELYTRCNNGRQKPTIRDLNATLSLMMKDLEDVFIVIDALDECAKGGEREELLALIEEIHAWSLLNIHLLVTSRPEPDIKAVLMPLVESQAISIQGSQVASDINLHIRDQLSADPKLKRWPSEVKAEIEKALEAGAKGMFRWVFCQLVALKKCRKRDVLLEALKNLPETLDDTYARILTEIDERDRQDARRALLWLAFSNRPLRIEEVAEAAVVDPELDPAFNPETRLLDPRNDILEILGSLVTVSSKGATIRSDVDLNHNTCISDDDLDDDSDYLPGEKIGLAHFSVKDYLVSKRIQCSKANIFSVTDIAANAFIAKSCLLYILHYDESDSKTTSSDDLEYFPLLQYACKFWYVHAKSIQVGNRKSIDSITFRLFLSDTALMAWLQVHRPGDLNRKPFSFSEDAYSPLYYASDIGHEAVVRALLEHKADVDVKGRYGETALHWAAAGGHEAVVRALLEHKADVDAKDKGGETALHRAAAAGHVAVVRALLEHKADVDVKLKSGGTALHRAASNGREAVVRVLMEHKADVNAKDKGGETALHRAAARGHEAVMRALLEHEADVDAKERVERRRCNGRPLAGTRRWCGC